MKTWIIVAIVIVLIIVAVVVYKSLSSKNTPAPTTVVQAPAQSNIFDFASAALPQLITAFGKNKPVTGIGASTPANASVVTLNAQGQPTGQGWINFNDAG